MQSVITKVPLVRPAKNRAYSEEELRKSTLICVRYLTFAQNSGSTTKLIPKGKCIIQEAPRNAYAFIASKNHLSPPIDGKRVYFNGRKITIEDAMNLLSKDKPEHIYTTPSSFNTLKVNKNIEWAVLSRLVTHPSRKQGVFPLYPGDEVQAII